MKRILRGILIIFATLILYAASAVLWPVTLGLFVLRPHLFAKLWDVKVF